MSKHLFTSWAEEYFYRPSFYQRFISYLLSPLSLIWCCGAKIRRALSKKEKFDLPVISVGNLNIGGSGKTPVSIAIAKTLERPAIVLRGYGRKSKGLVVVSDFGKILCTVRQSGDEAMLYAKELPNALVIVSEDRKQGILKARDMGAKAVILDDGFGKADIEKFEILIRPNPLPASTFCLPSGAYRESISNYKRADLVLEENVNFKRFVRVENPSPKMALATAIANPARLDKYLPLGVCAIKTFADHHIFTKAELEEILSKSDAKSLLVTTKDFVKIEDFGLPVSLLKLEITLSDEAMRKIEEFIKKEVGGF